MCYKNLEHNKVNINEEEFRVIIAKLQNFKACGPDKIGNTVPHYLPILSKPPSMLFESALKEGNIHHIGKRAKKLRFAKTKTKQWLRTTDQSPLFLNFSKLLEKLIFIEIYKKIVKPSLDKCLHANVEQLYFDGAHFKKRAAFLMKE